MKKSFLILSAGFMVLMLFFSACAPGGSDPNAVYKPDEWTGSIWLEDTEHYLIIHAPYGDVSIRYLYITEIVYTRVWNDPGELVDGIQNDRVTSGIFASDGKEYNLHVYNGYTNYLAVTCNGDLYVFNVESQDEFFEWKELIDNKSFQ